jgi:hypothetical protein
MAVLGNKGSVRLFLPSTKGLSEAEQAYVVVSSNITPEHLLGLDADKPELVQNIQVLTNLIREWNFTDDNGSPVEITYDNVKKLDMADFTYLGSWLAERLSAVSANMPPAVKKN